MNARLKHIFPVVAGLLAVLPSVASAADPVGIPDRVRGAERVVVASVSSMSASFETNEFGDQIIVSHLTLGVEETFKGKAERSIPMEVEGGTVGGITLEVSSMPKMKAGERAVFFLEKDSKGNYRAHLKGQGILKLGADNVVKGSSLNLGDIRAMAAQAGR